MQPGLSGYVPEGYGCFGIAIVYSVLVSAKAGMMNFPFSWVEIAWSVTGIPKICNSANSSEVLLDMAVTSTFIVL